MTRRTPIDPITRAPRPTTPEEAGSGAIPEADGSKASAPRVARSVENARVFSARDAPLYAFLSVLVLAAFVWLVEFWVARAEWSPQTPAYIFLTATVLFPLIMFGARWVGLPMMRRPKHMTASPGWKVGVATTFVPSGEDIGMLERTVRALVDMDYPHDTWVLDEGDDARVRALCRRLGARHFSRKSVERYQQPGGVFAGRTKHGNYNAWLDAIGFARYDIVAAFDPDHVPEGHFLTRVLGYFDDPSIGYVQAPQFYYNQRACLVARGAAEETYDYYSSIQMCCYALGFPIVTGCHNTHRVSALSEVGGFAAHEADDLLTTVHYRVAGWRGVYVPERLASGLTPVDMDGYLAQQRRWARSVFDIKLRILPKLGGALPLRERVVTFVHGLYYLYGLGTALGAALLAFMLVSGNRPAVFSVKSGEQVLALYAVLVLCQLYRQRFFLEPERERGLHWRAAILRLAKWPYMLLALRDALAGPNRGYTLTRKVAPVRRHYAAAPVQVIVAGMVGAALVAGAARGVVHNPSVVIAAAVVVTSALLVALLDLQRAPSPYDDELATRELGFQPPESLEVLGISSNGGMAASHALLPRSQP
jgi:cellulose synthase (UDP-forming)